MCHESAHRARWSLRAFSAQGSCHDCRSRAMLVVPTWWPTPVPFVLVSALASALRWMGRAPGMIQHGRPEWCPRRPAPGGRKGEGATNASESTLAVFSRRMVHGRGRVLSGALADSGWCPRRLSTTVGGGHNAESEGEGATNASEPTLTALQSEDGPRAWTRVPLPYDLLPYSRRAKGQGYLRVTSAGL